MDDQDYILFEDYISSELSKDEVITFESRLKSDSKFKKSFNAYKELSRFLEHELGNKEGSKSFKDNLKSISDSYFEETTTSKKVINFNFYKYAVAASVALLIGFFVYNQFTNPSYNDFMTYDTVSLTVRGNQDDIKTKVEEAFNTRNFSEAETYFTQLLEIDDSNQELVLYKGVTLLEQDKFDEADALFGKLSQGDSAFKNKATWYLALSKLKQKEFDECMVVLKSIPEDAEDYKQAQKLIKKLN